MARIRWILLWCFLLGCWRENGPVLSVEAGDVCILDAHCMNGGTCVSNEETGYNECNCQEGFSGARCSEYCPLNCENGGYCTVAPKGGALGLPEQNPTYKPEDYICKCFGHFTGRVCSIPFVNCGNSGRCMDGGECVVGKDMRHHCVCPEGSSGDACEEIHDVDTKPIEPYSVEKYKPDTASSTDPPEQDTFQVPGPSNPTEDSISSASDRDWIVPSSLLLMFGIVAATVIFSIKRRVRVTSFIEFAKVPQSERSNHNLRRLPRRFDHNEGPNLQPTSHDLL